MRLFGRKSRRAQIVYLLGRGVGRIALVNLIILAYVTAFAAFSAAEPSEAAEVAATLRAGVVFGYDVTLLDPIVIMVTAWSLAPIAHAVELFAVDIRIAWRSIRGETA